MPVAAGAWLTAGVVTGAPDAAASAAVLLWAIAFVVLVALVRPRRWGGSGVGRVAHVLAHAAIVVGVAAGVASHVAAALPARAAVAAAEVSGGRSLTVDVVAVGKIERGASGWRFDAVLERLAYGDTAITTPVPVLVRTGDVPPGLDLGARVTVTGTAWTPEPGERAVLVIDASTTPTLTSTPTGVLALASLLRHGLIAVTAGLPEPGGGLIAGLAVGDTSQVSDGLDAAMKSSSLSHLTAVSGANCALVVGIAFAVAAVCRAGRAVRVAAGLGALVAFVILVSPEPSVVRAATMAAIAMLGLLLGRIGAGLSLLTASVVLLLLLDPWLSRSIGFALSVAATAALLVLAGPLADGLSRWMPRPLALAVSVPLAAQLACGPIIALISPQVSVVGVAANMLAAPAAPVGTVLGLIACLCAGIPLLGTGVAALAWVPAAWIAATATTLSALPGSAIWWPDGVGGFAALGLISVAVVILLVRSPRPARVAASAVIAVTIVIAAGAVPAAQIGLRARQPEAWAIAVCDVGQGDAIAIRAAGHIALVDTGPDSRALSGCLETLGVDRVDLLILTHFDHDHDGGTSAVAGRVDTVLHGPTAAPDDERTLTRLRDAGARLVRADAGMTGTLGDARWRVLWPQPRTEAGNDGSVVLDIAGPSVPPMLMLGDLSAEGQRRLMATASLRPAYAVVKVSHHGSADQEPRLYRRVRATVALISVGENTYGHPRSETLAMLASVGARLARTDLEGLIMLWTEASTVRLWHEREPP
ncbi:ComEC/Rec2 family competence protein [uncultured Microbacterium sp.]|uniref:ComEC/Rec2 family competence protein n=1 Tax=uncultured Microbacterium sp. TaxID=191216 RepID=UPI0025D02569|nr:ComEC/Rec2 family competence protein [uncultured Microbacterium sp.]